MISQLLCKHFTGIIGKLGISPVQCKTITALNVSLGSYLHFEYLRAQNVLFEILKVILENPTKSTVLAKRFLVRSTKYLTKFDQGMILTEA
jgi:hypothetical protein